MKKHHTEDRYPDEAYEDDQYPDEADAEDEYPYDDDPEDRYLDEDDPEEDWRDDRYLEEEGPADRYPYANAPQARRPARRGRRGRRFFGWAGRKVGKIVTTALVIALVIAMLPFVWSWVSKLMPRLDYALASQKISEKMEEKGDYVADEVTITGILSGTQSIDLFGAQLPYLWVEADFVYKAQIGVKLSEVLLTPQEDSLLVIVPDTVVLYDSIECGEPRYTDTWNLQSKSNFQKLVAEQKNACHADVEANQEHMDKAWQDTCNQLGDWFRQWAGEELTLVFAHPGEAPAAQEDQPLEGAPT